MTVSALSPTAPASLLAELQLQNSKPAPAHTSSASLPADTVSLSSGAQKAAGAGDVDHDGDSH